MEGIGVQKQGRETEKDYGTGVAEEDSMDNSRQSLSAPATPSLGEVERGFPPQRLSDQSEPKIKRDERGYFIMTISENVKIHFEDYYQFLELIADRCVRTQSDAVSKSESIPETHGESIAHNRAERIILDLLMRTILSFYSDRHNLGVIMTPWCFGTVVLEKVEMLRDRIGRGDAAHLDVGEYPYDVVRYIDEIRVAVLLNVMKFPPKAFAMRWQYSELVRRYSTTLTNVTTSLQSILDIMKKHDQ